MQGFWLSTFDFCILPFDLFFPFGQAWPSSRPPGQPKVNLLHSKLRWTLVACALLLGAAFPLDGAQVKIQGQVSNGTTGKPVANQTLQLLMPRGGMQQVATAATDNSGHFVISSSELDPASFYLLQATYQDVNYHAPVKFDADGTAQIDVTVYDATHSEPTLRIQSARVIVRVEGGKARVQEMFAVRNSTSPPHSYVNPDGTFHFRLPKAAGEPTAAVAGLMNMPLPQPVNPGKGPGDFYLQYALKPGLTVMMVAYDADYAGNKLELGDSVTYPIEAAELFVSPPGLEVESALFKSAGTDAETGSQKYSAENLKAGAALAATVSGEAATSEPATSQAEAQVKSLPNSMTRLGGPLLACFLLVLLWGLGVRVAKEWPAWKARQSASQIQKKLAAEVEALLNALADLDELFADGKIAEKPYWKERLELKARLVATLKKAPPALLDSYATRHNPR